MKIVITAGGTKEAIDPVRYIHNRSSGKQGLALVQEALKAGHDVTLIHTLDADKVQGLEAKLISVESAEQMYDAVHREMQTADALIMAAAVADYIPVDVAEHKLKKANTEELVIRLKKTQDILLSFKDSDKIIVGFAAETGDENFSVLEYGQQKLGKKGCDILVVNEVSSTKGFGQDTNTVDLLFKDGRESIHSQGTKAEVAAMIIGQMSSYDDKA